MHPTRETRFRSRFIYSFDSSEIIHDHIAADLDTSHNSQLAASTQGNDFWSVHIHIVPVFVIYSHHRLRFRTPHH